MTVEHDVSNSRFFVHVEGDDDAELVYSMAGPRRIELVHTYVPESARGHGVAEALAKAAMDFARERGLNVVPTCPFVRRWLAHHPEEGKLVDAPYAKSLEDRTRP